MPGLRALIALTGLALLASACGSSKAPTVANLATTTSQNAAAKSSSGSAPSVRQSLLKYSRCMRAHGVTNFPDPSGGGFQVSGLDRSAPIFKAAQATCLKNLPGGGPGSGPPPSSQELTHMDRVAACMRKHSVPDFPDPASHAPSAPPANGVISNIEGVIFVFTDPSELQTPDFARAAAACDFPLHNH